MNELPQIASSQNHNFQNAVGAPTPNFLSMRGPNHSKGVSHGAEHRYTEEVEAVGTQYTNADVTSIMGGDEMMQQQVPPNDASMVQDQDL